MKLMMPKVLYIFIFDLEKRCMLFVFEKMVVIYMIPCQKKGH